MTDAIMNTIQQNPHKVFFPNLGHDNIFTNGITLDKIMFKIPGTDFAIYWYGFLIALGLLLAVIYGFRKFRKFGINPDRATDAIIGGVVGAVIFARIYYVVFSWSTYVIDGKIDWAAIFSIRDGGLAIYGGLIGALLTAGVIARWRKIKLLPLFDIAAMGFLIGQAIGRWGNFMNMEAYGAPTNLPWGMTSANIMADLGRQFPGLEQSALLAHPTFLYESLWCILGFVLLSIYMKHRKFDGEIFFMYLGWYGFGRMLIEGLRTDSLYVSGTGIRVSQVLAACCVAASLIIILTIRLRIKRNGGYKFFYETEDSIKQIEEYDNSLKKSKSKAKVDMAKEIDNAFDEPAEKKKEVLDDDEVDMKQLSEDAEHNDADAAAEAFSDDIDTDGDGDTDDVNS